MLLLKGCAVMSEEARIKEILMDQLKLDENSVGYDTSIDSLAIDSLELLELVVTIEEEFDISLDDTKLKKMDTMGEMCDYIMETIRDEQ